MEKIFHTFLMDRAHSKKRKLNKILLRAMYNSRPNIKLRTRRRGRRTLYKVTYIEEKESVKKALLAFSKSLNENKNPKFLISLEKELLILSSGKSPITIKRDVLHRTALENMPYSWKRRRKKRKSRKRNMNQVNRFYSNNRFNSNQRKR